MANTTIKRSGINYMLICSDCGKVIATAYNQKEKKRCAIYHAEILAIKSSLNSVSDSVEALNGWLKGNIFRDESCNRFIRIAHVFHKHF